MNIRTILLTFTCLLWCSGATSTPTADGTVSTTGATSPTTFLHIPSSGRTADSLWGVSMTTRPGLLAVAGLWRTILAVRPANQDVIRVIRVDGGSAAAWLEASVGAIAGVVVDDGVEALVGLTLSCAGARRATTTASLGASLACRWSMGPSWSGAVAVDGIVVAASGSHPPPTPILGIGAAWVIDASGTTIAIDGFAQADTPLALLCSARIAVAPGVVVTSAFRTWPSTLRVGATAEADRNLAVGCTIDHRRHLGWLPGLSLRWRWS